MSERAREAAIDAACSYIETGAADLAANAAIDAFLAQLKADGYKLVRREATEEMCKSVRHLGYLDDSWDLDKTIPEVFAEMWDAAPEAGQ